MSTTDPNAPAHLRNEERSTRARDPERVPLYRFAGPRYWGVWLGIAIVRLVNFLPLRGQMWVGRKVGRLALLISRKAKKFCLVEKNSCVLKNKLHIHSEMISEIKKIIIQNANSRFL